MNDLTRATRDQRAILEAYIATGSIEEAAHKLGIKYQAARHRLQALYRRTGARNVAQAAYWLGIERAATQSEQKDSAHMFANGINGL